LSETPDLPTTENRAPAAGSVPLAHDPTAYEAVLERDGLKVSRSPWGPDDEIGRLNWLTAESQRQILGQLDGTKIFDLAVDYFVGMPSWTAAGDPKYDIWMTHTPSGSVLDNLSGAGPDAHRTYAYSGDAIEMYTHCGTHIDTLNHMGYFGCFWNGWTPEEHLGSRCWTKGGAEKFPPLISRGVLLDIAGLHGVDCLPPSYEVTPDDLRKAAREQRVELRRGDIVQIRTGRMTVWPDSEAMLHDQPGLGVPAAEHLCREVGAMCVGGDTISLEVVPSPDPDVFLPVHSYMFATAGAQIMEVVYLEELAAEKQYEFAFLGFPLKLTGATGAPMRPIAVPLR
jgi:kynurenine formamidase